MKKKVGSGKWEVGSRKWEVGSRKWEVGSRKWEGRGATKVRIAQRAWYLAQGTEVRSPEGEGKTEGRWTKDDLEFGIGSWILHLESWILRPEP
ncbi:MAG: hypothetical protein CVU57_18265 [Deltaproteobacteria bacterium HGW-Deltaproteobacteria-15]|nr:MAG: hypothetical protein CVU57_18265 [Deltaproteobacteria bacterium HGW-Deltaproteobacteria-15]